ISRDKSIPALKRWLAANIHRPGATYPPKELLNRVFGHGYDTAGLVSYLENKYLGTNWTHQTFRLESFWRLMPNHFRNNLSNSARPLTDRSIRLPPLVKMSFESVRVTLPSRVSRVHTRFFLKCEFGEVC